MKKALLLALLLPILSACSGHRTDSPPEPDGDTVEVIIDNPE